MLRQAQRSFSTSLRLGNLNAFISPQSPDGLFPVTPKVGGKRGATGIEGLSVAVKDNICTTSHPTTCASNILNGFVSPFPATVVKLLEEAGATVIGKTNLDEFGMGSHSANAKGGYVRNPHSRNDQALSAGGSSGGSAVAVSANACDVSLGTDTGGSVRLPAAYTGIVGFKPSYGLVSRHGVIPYANSLDTVGIMAFGIQTVKRAFNVINQFDECDPTSLHLETRRPIQGSTKRSDNMSLRIGVPLEYNTFELDPLVRRTWAYTLSSLQDRGHKIVPVSLPLTRSALSAYYILAPSEASSNLAKYDGIRYGKLSNPEDTSKRHVLYSKARGSGFSAEVKRRILLGSYSLSAGAIDNYFIQAQKVRRMVRSEFDSVFRFANPLLDTKETGPMTAESPQVDVLVTPTAPTLPPSISALSKRTPIDSFNDDVLTVPASLAGLPAVSVPVSLHDEQLGLGNPSVPFAGIQIIGQLGDDELVLRVAAQLEGL